MEPEFKDALEAISKGWLSATLEFLDMKFQENFKQRKNLSSQLKLLYQQAIAKSLKLQGAKVSGVINIALKQF